MVLQTLRIKCWAPALQRSGDGTLASKLLVSAKNRLTAAEWGVGAEAFLKPNHVSAKPDQNRDKSDKLKNTYSSPQTGRTVLNCIRSCSQSSTRAAASLILLVPWSAETVSDMSVDNSHVASFQLARRHKRREAEFPLRRWSPRTSSRSQRGSSCCSLRKRTRRIVVCALVRRLGGNFEDIPSDKPWRKQCPQ